MKIALTLVPLMLAFLICGETNIQAGEVVCAGNDAACREFLLLAENGQFERIADQVDATRSYSEPARGLIGRAYLMLAGRAGNTAAQEEQFCRKALEYGATSAYMCLYFLSAGQDSEAALGFLKQYVATGSVDPVPYMLLGEAELNKKNYQSANAYLRQAKKLSRGHSANLDWMLFQVSYMLGDYAYALVALEGVMAHGQFVQEFTALASDPRFAGMLARPEFGKYQPLVKEPAALAKS